MQTIIIDETIEGIHLNFIIKTDLTSHEKEAAIINWFYRTSDYTGESFCDYVEDKGLHKCKLIS